MEEYGEENVISSRHLNKSLSTFSIYFSNGEKVGRLCWHSGRSSTEERHAGKHNHCLYVRQRGTDGNTRLPQLGIKLSFQRGK